MKQAWNLALSMYLYVRRVAVFLIVLEKYDTCIYDQHLI